VCSLAEQSIENVEIEHRKTQKKKLFRNLKYEVMYRCITIINKDRNY